ncbi:hypothetical protein GCM10010466_56630 [Planomonospora alba]|uniref:Uncharacterized protein n=1 Tax=Planomonospora alba TaxID=161354 RepID=A0ABP6NUN9_9ACTN
MSERETPRGRLTRLMTERRDELGLYWNDVAERAGLTKEGLRTVRAGVGTMRPPTKRGIETALQWVRGSVDRVLDGGDPVPLESAGTAPSPAGPSALGSAAAAPASAAAGTVREAAGAGVDAEALRAYLDIFRETGRRTGRTLGDMLVAGGYASPQDLALTLRRPDPVVEELEGDPGLPDEVKQRILEGYRALRREIAESLRRPD